MGGGPLIHAFSWSFSAFFRVEGHSIPMHEELSFAKCPGIWNDASRRMGENAAPCYRRQAFLAAGGQLTWSFM